MVLDVPNIGIGRYIRVDIGHIIQGGGVGHHPVWIGDVGGDPLYSQDNGGFPSQGRNMAYGQATSEATLCKMVFPPLGEQGGGLCGSQVWRRRSYISLRDRIW